MKSFIKALLYGALGMGALATIIGCGKFILWVVTNHGLLAVLGYLSVTAFTIAMVAILGILTVALIEGVFEGEESSPILKKLEETFPFLKSPF